MPKMFGFSRRRMKLGRLKVHLGDPSQGTRSPSRPTKRVNQSDGENVVSASVSGRSDDINCPCSVGAFDPSKRSLGSSDNWMVLPTEGHKPAPRFHHAAAVVGSKMVVVGGDSGRGLLDDTLILSLDKLTWAAAAPAPKIPLSPSGCSLKIPACKGHSLVSWGKMVLLIGGKTDPVSHKISVWSFDVETECWAHIEAKGDIPAARSGHTVIRAGPALILFGGEDAKRRKLNDLHMFDLKSLTWLPLHYTGTGPSPRSNHVAALYDDRFLFVFGGQSKSRILNDLYSLDFESMVWTRLKICGHHPSPRAGCCGALCGTKWYITGGGSKKKRHLETLVFDVLKFEWSVSVTSPGASVTTNKGFSVVPVRHSDKSFLVAFGGNKKEPSNQSEILVLFNNEHSMSWRSAPDALSYEDCPASTKDLGAHLNSAAPPCSVDPVGRHSLASAVEQHASGRKSVSDSSTDLHSISSTMSLRKQFHHEEDYNLAIRMLKSPEDDKHKAMEQRSKKLETAVEMDIAGILASTEENLFDSESSNLYQKLGNNDLMADSNHIAPPETDGRSGLLANPYIYQLYETKIVTLTRKNVLLEEQLTAALANQEAAENNLSSALKSRQDMEKKLADAMKEVELLKEKLAGMELAQEEANNLSNMSHSDNVRLEHDVAFLKAVLDDTQKELHSTRGVLAGERARAFQLQVEAFHLKQRLQSMENRAPTPRKPFHI
ncbi:acyl-CoA-binding domain-containing protein 6 [Phoenix dactylifera]|uniref:Acyl-CoA-binding domain-containing protein 6 n=1 Tax=Phoenix dactylifera TaxID=42345 RepID=A0A8B8ZL50_PHODC|nr:acyl-CoA-binding domain-containing protein 6 [Phoenix dactylifera]